MHVSYIILQILYCNAQWDPMNNKLSSILSGTSIITFFASPLIARLFNIIFMTTVTLTYADVKSICRFLEAFMFPSGSCGFTKMRLITWIVVFKTLMVYIPLQYWQFQRTLLLTSFHKMKLARIRITWPNWNMLYQ